MDSDSEEIDERDKQDDEVDEDSERKHLPDIDWSNAVPEVVEYNDSDSWERQIRVQLLGRQNVPATEQDILDAIEVVSQQKTAHKPTLWGDPKATELNGDNMSQGLVARKSAYGSVGQSSPKAIDPSPSVTMTEIDTEYIDDEVDTATLKFNEDIKILLIKGPDWRLICHFMGVNAVRDVKVARSENITLIGWLQQENLVKFMASKGYKFAGEINFDQNGEAVPVSKHTWTLKKEEYIFTNGGFLFFESASGKQGDNIAFMAWTTPQVSMSGLTCYSTRIRKSKQLLEELEAFTKKNNCLRGAKIRDVHVGTGQFQEVHPQNKYNWDNYYFSKDIRDLFQLEVFGFLKNTARYNQLGIKKRGVLLYGVPGTGKTTVGHIICNYAEDHTVIWITPDLIAENNNGKFSVKLLYHLADYVSPVVIILEDLDLFTEDRDSSQQNLGLGALMNILDGVNTVQNAVTIATTNRLELIEKALSNRPGRFDSVVEVPALNKELRRKMLVDRLAGCDLVATGSIEIVDYIVERSDGWTGAEVQEFVNRMNLYFINKGEDENRIINQKAVDEVLQIIGNLCLSHKGKKKSLGFN